MKITKYVHSCLLVEMPAPVNRTVLFDPGSMSREALDITALEFLDDIFITHQHNDHMDTDFIKALVAKFPNVRITGPEDAVKLLQQADIDASAVAPEGVVFFDAPHESVAPLFPAPEEIGIHYLDTLSNPGDSHSFHETKKILALPVQAPWGSSIRAIQLALELRPEHIIPIHDWHWREEVRQQMYEGMEKVFAEQGITFHKMETGVPVVID